jgi:flavin reductase (DIM6/NTAB) family NADH-FMN oxidoreductase RutF
VAAPRTIVGPIPEGQDPEAYDRLRRRVLWSMPTGLYVMGSRHEDRQNLMTLDWATQVATEPKLVAVSVDQAARTAELVAAGGVFALSLLDRSDRAIVRKFVKPVERRDDGTLNGFPVWQAATGAPILERAVAWLDCEVRQGIDVGSHTVFLGEVVHAGATGEEELPVLRMEDTRMSYGG